MKDVCPDCGLSYRAIGHPMGRCGAGKVTCPAAEPEGTVTQPEGTVTRPEGTVTGTVTEESKETKQQRWDRENKGRMKKWRREYMAKYRKRGVSRQNR